MDKKKIIPLFITNLILLTIFSMPFIFFSSVTISLFTSTSKGTSFPKTLFVPHLSLLLVCLIAHSLSLVVQIKMLKCSNFIVSIRYYAKKICWISIINLIVTLTLCFYFILVYLLGKSVLSIRIVSLFDLLTILLLATFLLIYPVICFAIFIRCCKKTQK